MHPDLELIVALWELDHQVDEAKARASDLKAVVTKAGQQIDALTGALSDLAGRIAETVQQESEVQKELDKYIMRTERTRVLLDGHRAVDFMTVEKQLEQCQTRVEELEDQLLGLMSVREELQGEAKQVEARREETREAKGHAHTQWVDEGREIRSQLEALWPRRQSAAELLNRDLLKRYTGFRERGLVPLASVGTKFCAACHVSVQDQMRLEVQNGRRVHNCRGCGRWLLPKADESDAELADDAADE